METRWMVLYLCAIVFIFVGVTTNSFVIYKLLKRKRAIGDIFALNMAIVDIVYLLLQLTEEVNEFFDFYAPEFIPIFANYLRLLCYLASINYFYLYMLTRFFVVIWPIQTSLYFKRWHAHALVVVNLLVCSVHMSERLYIYWDKLTSIKMIDFSTWDLGYMDLVNNVLPPFFLRFQKCYGNTILLLFGLTILLVVYVCFRLIRKDPTDNPEIIKRKKRAILTICLCFFVFVVFHFSSIFVQMIWQLTGTVSTFVFWFFVKFQIIGFALNPLLYYKAKVATRSAAGTQMTNSHPRLRRSVT